MTNYYISQSKIINLALISTAVFILFPLFVRAAASCSISGPSTVRVGQRFSVNWSNSAGVNLLTSSGWSSTGGQIEPISRLGTPAGGPYGLQACPPGDSSFDCVWGGTSATAGAISKLQSLGLLSNPNCSLNPADPFCGGLCFARPGSASVTITAGDISSSDQCSYTVTAIPATPPTPKIESIENGVITWSIPSCWGTTYATEYKIYYCDTGPSCNPTTLLTTVSPSAYLTGGSINPVTGFSYTDSNLFISHTYQITHGSFDPTAMYRYRIQANNDSGSIDSAIFTVSGVAVDSAKFVSQTVPISMEAGETKIVSITMKNCRIDNNCASLKTWRSGTYFLVALKNIWGVTKVDVPFDISPEAAIVFSFPITAPSEIKADVNGDGITDCTVIDQYSMRCGFRWQMLQSWFGQETADAEITVIAAAEGTGAMCAGT